MADKFNFDVFLSHNGKDKPAVEHIARLLRDKYNLKAWLDKWHLVPGDPWQEGLEDALDECQTFAVFLVVQRDFIVLRDFGWYYETLRLGRFELGLCDRERVRLR